MRQETHSNPDEAPRSLGNPAVRQRRRAMLNTSHMRPLNDYVARLRRECEVGEIPDFDPLDGGIEAQVLFLFQKAGEQTVGSTGSGFISRNNNDDTAEATFNFMHEAGIPRELTVTWNVVPWWNGTNKVSAVERRAGMKYLGELLELLPRLRAVVLVGGEAQKAWHFVACRDLCVFSSYHPSPIVRASRREEWDAIPQEWAKVKPVLGLS